jgi:hypothetical protein
MTCSGTPDPGACPCGIPEFPVVICNPANQPQVLYRIGDYLAFRDRLLRPLPGEQQLNLWRPGAEGDLAVQMMEWWAYLADILTFYDERIANECYLRTAQLPESVNHLVQILGYRPRPAFGAKVTLAGLVTPSARLPVMLPKGLQVQSKPGPGLPPQVFELEATSSLQGPDVITSVVTPASTLVSAPPQSSTAAGDGGLWLKGKVTSIKPGVDLLLINRSALAAVPSVTDFAWINLTDVAPATDPTGKPVTALTYKLISGALAADGTIADYALMRSSQSSPLWTFPSTAKVITTTSVDLAGLVRTLTPGSLFLLDVPSGSTPKPTAAVVATYAELLWYANCGATADPATSPDPTKVTPVGIPLSTLTFAAISGADSLAPNTVTIRYGFKPVGDLVAVLTSDALSYPSGGSSVSPSPSPAGGPATTAFPDGQPTVLIEDSAGNATEAVLTADSATSAKFAPSPPNDALTLSSPMDVLFNLLPFSRGKTVALEILGSGNPAVAGQDFALKNAPVTYFADPASVSGDGFSSTVQVSVNNVLWKEVQSFYGQASDAQIFVLREDDAGKTHVTFGDGINGALPPTGVNNIIASYRYGAGSAAPRAETLTVVQTPQPGLKSIRNPLVPTGGGDADSPDRLRGLAPKSVLTFNRAVALDDYAAIALTNSSVNQAVAGYAFDPVSQRPKVTLWVAGDGAKAAAAQTLAGITMPGQGLNIVAATPVNAWLSLTFVCDGALDAPAIQAALTTALTDPDAGLFGARVIGIGEAIYDSQIEAACLKVAGVSAVRSLELQTGFSFRVHYGVRRFPHVVRFKTPQGCAGRRHDPGPGAYFKLGDLNLTASFAGAA